MIEQIARNIMFSDEPSQMKCLDKRWWTEDPVWLEKSWYSSHVMTNKGLSAQSGIKILDSKDVMLQSRKMDELPTGVLLQERSQF